MTISKMTLNSYIKFFNFFRSSEILLHPQIGFLMKNFYGFFCVLISSKREKNR